MSKLDKPYLKLLKKVRGKGTFTPDRTGTGTYSLFGEQMKFDLSKQFPLLTTKQMAWKWTIEELLWMLRGSDSVAELRAKGVKWWDSWARKDDDTIGPGYGTQFRNIIFYRSIKPKIYPSQTGPSLEPIRTVFGVGYYGEEQPNDPWRHILVNVWREMLRRCYNPRCKPYPAYGGKGVHVHPDWHCYATFASEVKKLPGWSKKMEFPDDFSLDKDALWASNQYSKETCAWISHRNQSFNLSNSKPFKAINPEGKEIIIPSTGESLRVYNLNQSATYRCLNGQLNQHHNWHTFDYLQPDKDDEVLRATEVDQLLDLLAELKHNSDSRRHIITLFNPQDLGKQQLPPCHGNIIQFFILDNKLHCTMYQRSCDLFLGGPVNIATYSLLTLFLAKWLRLKPGTFTHSIGVAHIYSTHLEAVDIQLKREPKSSPIVGLSGLFEDQSVEGFLKEIEELTPDKIQLSGYYPDMAIKAPVAI